jgi:hypothetical protein
VTRDEAIDLARAESEAPDLVWVERPTLLHGRATGPGTCPCGCGSQSGDDPQDYAAILVERRPGPVLIIDRHTGERKYRAHRADGTPRTEQELADFDALKPACSVVELPKRCYPKQLLAIESRPKVKGIFGGVRGGKTEALAEELLDVWIELGGPGVVLWWVAPEMAHTLRAIEKLITGKAIRGGANPEVRPPKLPPFLVLSSPDPSSKERTLDQIKRRKPIVLLDGTIIELRYANAGDGASLKGDNVAWIGVDEGAEVDSEDAWAIMIQRVTDSGGWISTATTPVVGSPLKHLVYDEGQDLAANDTAANDRTYANLTGWVHLSMRDNPWVPPREVEIQRAIALKQPNGEDRVRQDIDGEWIVVGQRMWEHLDEARHVVTGPWRDVERYEVDGRPLENITPYAARAFFRKTQADLTRVGGQDFNLRGHFTVVIQVGCPEGLDRTDPDNWVIFVEDEVRKAGEPYVAARFLANEAGAYRGQDHDYFRGLAIACDPSGAQDHPTESASGNVSTTYTQADAFIRMGFDCRPCHLTAKGKPKNPEKLAQQAILHMLMRRPGLSSVETSRLSTRILIHKARCPDLLKGLREQTCNERGHLVKRSDTYADRISDPVDALLYILWALFSDAEYYPPVKVEYG